MGEKSKVKMASLTIREVPFFIFALSKKCREK
jgi:hypothetical protein